MAIACRLDDGQYVLARNFEQIQPQGVHSTREQPPPTESFECWTGTGWSRDQDKARRFTSQQDALDFLALGVIDQQQ